MMPTLLGVSVMVATPFGFVRTDLRDACAHGRSTRWFLSPRPNWSRQVALIVTLRPTNAWLRFSFIDRQTIGGLNGCRPVAEVVVRIGLAGGERDRPSARASPAIAAHFVFAGAVCVQPAWRTSQTTYLPGFRLRAVRPARAVVVGAGDRRLAGLERAVAVGVDVGADDPAREGVLARVLVAVGVVVLVLDAGLRAACGSCRSRCRSR